MTDYLGALAQRSVARAPAVRPIVSPRFVIRRWPEPAPASLEEEWHVVSPQRPTPPAPHVPRDEGRPPRAPALQQAPGSQAQRDTVKPVRAAPETSRALPPPAPLVASPLVGTPQRPQQVSASSAIVERTILREVLAQPVSAVPRTVSDDALRERSAHVQTRVAEPTLALSPERAGARERESRTSEDREERRPSRTEHPVAVPSRRVLPPPRQPDVHITIGRVDVRAVVSAPATPPEPRVAESSRVAPLGLAAYLQRRQARKP